MHSRLQVLVEFQTTTGPIPVRVPCFCFDDDSSYLSRSPKNEGPPSSFVTLIIRSISSVRKVALTHACASWLCSYGGVMTVTGTSRLARDSRENAAMRALVLLTLAIGFAAHADDGILGPADYMKMLEESKLHYKVSDKPAAKPVEELNCERRTEMHRVVEKSDGKSLVVWDVKPEATKLLREGEAAWDKKNYDAAAAKYKAAIVADPEAVTGYFFLGDALLFGHHDAKGALELYRKGLALDSTLPAGHFFASTALMRLGKPDEAREEIVQALAYYPGYEAVWKIAAAQPEYWHNRPIVRHRFQPPIGYLGQKSADGTVEIYSGPQAQWAGYAICKAAWANEARFKDGHGDEENWSLDEERACVLNQLQASYNLAAANIEEAQKKKGVKAPEAKDEEIVAALPPLERHLYDVTKAKLLDGYILFEIIGQHCPIGMSLLADAPRAGVETYIRTYVIVAK